jgi:hypothetical protein
MTPRFIILTPYALLIFGELILGLNVHSFILLLSSFFF